MTVKKIFKFNKKYIILYYQFKYISILLKIQNGLIKRGLFINRRNLNVELFGH